MATEPAKENKKRRLLPILPFIIFIVLVVGVTIHLYSNNAVQADEETDSPLVGKRAPQAVFSTLKTNQLIERNELQGKYIMMNVFASWCVSCLSEHAYLMRPETQKFLKANHIAFYGINWADRKADAIKWLERYGNPYHEVLIDKNNTFLVGMGLVGTPETYVLNANGRIIYHKRGPITQSSLEHIKQKINSAEHAAR